MSIIEEQINAVQQEITDAGATLDRPRLRAVLRLAQTRLEALSVGKGEAPAHVSLPPGRYLVTPDPGGELVLYGFRWRVLEGPTVPVTSVPQERGTRRAIETLLIIAAIVWGDGT